uniref:Uncharacterized protein n=1 Tax=Acrobeloides nanus TaxID=290746 RepID=A0A914DAN4_9BILA
MTRLNICAKHPIIMDQMPMIHKRNIDNVRIASLLNIIIRVRKSKPKPKKVETKTVREKPESIHFLSVS